MPKGTSSSSGGHRQVMTTPSKTSTKNSGIAKVAGTTPPKAGPMSHKQMNAHKGGKKGY